MAQKSAILFNNLLDASDMLTVRLLCPLSRNAELVLRRAIPQTAQHGMKRFEYLFTIEQATMYRSASVLESAAFARHECACRVNALASIPIG